MSPDTYAWSTMCFIAFCLGVYVAQDWNGGVRVSHNIDEHTWMNHGQASISVSLGREFDWDGEFKNKAIVVNPHFEMGRDGKIVVKDFSIEESLLRPEGK